MAEEKSGIQNKWLLIIALALGVVVVVIYNAHVTAIKQSIESDMIEVVRVTEQLSAGERVTADVIEKHEIPQAWVQTMGDPVRWSERETILRSATYDLKRPIGKDEVLRWSDVSGAVDRRREKAPPGTIRKIINIATDQSPGESLQSGDYINLLGIFSPPGGETRYYRVIEGVPFLNAGGVVSGNDIDSGRRGSRPMSSYRRIEIAVTKEVSEQLSNLETHLMGEWKLEIMRIGESLPLDHGQVNAALKQLAEQARPPISRGTAAPLPPSGQGSEYEFGG